MNSRFCLWSMGSLMMLMLQIASAQETKQHTIQKTNPVDLVPINSDQKTKTTKKISLDFQDIEVRRILQLLADFTGLNIVVADSVQGNMTLRLKDVAWEQALAMILKTKHLEQRRHGNIIWIAPITELIKKDQEQVDCLVQSMNLQPLHLEYIQLNYAKAADIEKLMIQSQSNRQNKQTMSGGSLLSPRGHVAVDLRTNTLMIHDTPEQIEQIRNMIAILDVPVQQVMVEARIVRANTDFSKEMGVKWGMLSQHTHSGKQVLVGGSEQALWDASQPSQGTATNNRMEQSDHLNVDLGVTAIGAGRIALGLLNLPDFMLDLELSAVQADGYGEVISAPKVMTADKQTAKVVSGTQVPYQSVTGTGTNQTASTAFKDVLLSLSVTPSITPDGQVQMQLDISSDSIGQPAPNGELLLNKNAINTNVLVNNGETVVLGGIFEQTDRRLQTKIPILGNIPFLRKLFSNNSKASNKRELLIFVTPRIINDTLVRNH